ncbi:MAG: tRNA (adenosine(37)-N6)-threonylcarbamoyltransferase complex dimerization subunit type 1 TsaB [Betaproteobacteria bacterium]|nr:tRNA (adenosine(37)-N6)-threonylcarbamoyltransferase complex dimerization subunit type 1 TsaB [Betaproteobacteria bacterium]
MLICRYSHGQRRSGLFYTDQMKLLALDTSTDRLCVALCRAAGVDGHEEPGGPLVSKRLLPAAAALLARHGLSWGDLDGLAYGEGPGAFTGLRATCAAVQGLALGLNLPAVPVSSLLIMADDARQQAVAGGVLPPQQACTVAVAVDARMGQVYDDLMRWDGVRWVLDPKPQVRSPAEVLQAWTSERAGAAVQERWLFAGSGLAFMTDAHGAVLREQALCWLVQAVDRSAALGRCAAAAWLGVAHRDAAQVMPRYVRDRVALTTAERDSGARALTAQPLEGQGGAV